MSAACSAVLKDLDRIEKNIKVEGERTKENLARFLEVPDVYLRGSDDFDCGSFWETGKWSNDSVKNRKICLATMKKILQRYVMCREQPL